MMLGVNNNNNNYTFFRCYSLHYFLLEIVNLNGVYLEDFNLDQTSIE